MSFKMGPSSDPSEQGIYDLREDKPRRVIVASSAVLKDDSLNRPTSSSPGFCSVSGFISVLVVECFLLETHLTMIEELRHATAAV